MKKILLILGFFMAASWADAQVYIEKDFQQSVLQVNTSKTRSDYDNLFQKFSKFTSTKTSERWQAYYYAAVSMYLKTEVQLDQTTHEDLSASNALATKFANGATSQQDNAEVNILLGLIYFQKIQINPSSNTQKDLDLISQTIAKAEATTPNNPRLAILKARMKEKSGDKSAAELLLKKATSGFGSKNSSDNTAPMWGRQLIQSNK
ncbi:hypothetical protein [Chryseobacterium sp. ERMR1:04]|uniref:hypothetical protein n=1 Tax=Chryseobacterium sp. ERMR1:04 TaxID=1705393 RepID=UPI0006C8608A|nr:hypothetical protein [Chryseobacterium sp. ERMR1:04]KPH11506.1 hypothetical protein AMQ68_19075 [Chryseobacterium sp. ERMR1:04]